MTTISISENLNLDKVHFESFDEFQIYMVQLREKLRLTKKHKEILDSRMEDFYKNPSDHLTLAEFKEKYKR